MAFCLLGARDPLAELSWLETLASSLSPSREFFPLLAEMTATISGYLVLKQLYLWEILLRLIPKCWLFIELLLQSL